MRQWTNCLKTYVMTHLPFTPFYFLRHGETDWNKNQVFMGGQDIPLNEVGRAQANLIPDHIKGLRIDHIASSPLSRALETAQIVNEHLGCSITIVDALRECCWGSAEGKPYDHKMLENWWAGTIPEGGESHTAFGTRVITGVKKALDLAPHVLIVSHGGVYHTLSRIMQWPSIDLKNCALMIHQPPLDQTQSWTITSLVHH